MKILLVGGGTGGHIMPTLAVAESLKSKAPDSVMLYVGSTRREDEALVRTFGLEFRAIATGKLRRYFDLQNIADMGQVLRGVWQAARIIREFRPDVIFAKGGFVSVPVILAARLYRVPFVSHESDAVIGLANRLGFAGARAVATAFPVEVYPSQYQSKLRYVGLPMTKSMLLAQPKNPFGGAKPLVVIMGGSQGAAAINELVWEVLPQMLEKYNVLHQAGAGGVDRGEELRRQLPAGLAQSYKVISFDPNLRHYAQAADVVVARAGSSLNELAAWAKPVVTIPLPGSASNHQAANAEWFSQNGAALALPQTNLTGGLLLAAIDHVVSDAAYRDELVDNIARLGHIHRSAADSIAAMLLQK